MDARAGANGISTMLGLWGGVNLLLAAGVTITGTNAATPLQTLWVISTSVFAIASAYFIRRGNRSIALVTYSAWAIGLLAGFVWLMSESGRGHFLPGYAIGMLLFLAGGVFLTYALGDTESRMS